MIKFFKKYSLVLFLAIIAGFFIGFKIFGDTENKISEEVPLPETKVLEPTTTFVQQPNPTLKPTSSPNFDLSEEEVNQIMKELNVDPDNPSMEDVGKLFQYLMEMENEN